MKKFWVCFQKELVSHSVSTVTGNVYTGRADALINVRGNDLCVIPVNSVHSYSLCYLAHDPSAKHNDLYHADEQLPTPCYRIYALWNSCIWSSTVTFGEDLRAVLPNKSRHICHFTIFTSFYVSLWVPSLRCCKKHQRSLCKSVDKAGVYPWRAYYFTAVQVF